MLRSLDETAESEVLLNDDIWGHGVSTGINFGIRNDNNIPLTAAMTNRICVVSVAHVK